jgi:hypothetical protein
MKTTRALAAGLGVWAAQGIAAAQGPAIEFQVNTYTTGFQALPSIASDADGNFLVVWHSVGQDGSSGGVYARRYLPSGEPVEVSEFQVNSYVTGAQLAPSVASDPSGRRVVVWDSFGQDGSDRGIYRRQLDATGTLGPEFRVNTVNTEDDQRSASVAMDADGNFVVVWADRNGSAYEIRARRFSAAGAPQGTEFTVNSFTLGYQDTPAVAMSPAGDFVVLWMSQSQDGDGDGVFGRRFSSLGVAQASEFRVNTSTTGDQFSPQLAMHTDGSFVAVWTGLDGSEHGAFARRYDANGQPRGAEFQVNSYTTGRQIVPSVALDPAGDFVVAWGSGPPGYYDVIARFFDAAGRPRSAAFQVNSFTTGHQRLPAVAALPGALTFVVAWQSDGQDGDADGVFARVVPLDLIFRDGFQAAGDVPGEWPAFFAVERLE